MLSEMQKGAGEKSPAGLRRPDSSRPDEIPDRRTSKHFATPSRERSFLARATRYPRASWATQANRHRAGGRAAPRRSRNAGNTWIQANVNDGLAADFELLLRGFTGPVG